MCDVYLVLSIGVSIILNTNLASKVSPMFSHVN